MKGLKIIPMFLILIALSFLGMLFVQANKEEVVIHFLTLETPMAPLGLVVLTSVLLGMVLSGLLCSIELLALAVQNKNLKRKLTANGNRLKIPSRLGQETVTPHPSSTTSHLS